MEKVGKNLIKLKNDIISLTQLTSKINQNNFNYVVALNNIIELLYMNNNLQNGNYEETLQEADIKYIKEIFSGVCFTVKEQNQYIKTHDMNFIEEKNELINGCLWVSAISSLNYINYGIDYVDLLNQGYFGIESAINKYGKDSTKAFSTLVKEEVILSLMKYVREYGKYGHISKKELHIISNLDYWKDLYLMQREHEGTSEDLAYYFSCPQDSMKKLITLSQGTIELDSSEVELDDKRSEASVVDIEEVAVDKLYFEDLLETCELALNKEEKYILYHLIGINNYSCMSKVEISSHLGCSTTSLNQTIEKALIKIRNKYKVIQDRRTGLLNINDVKKLRKQGITF